MPKEIIKDIKSEFVEVAELPESLQEVINDDGVLFGSNGIPYRRFIRKYTHEWFMASPDHLNKNNSVIVAREEPSKKTDMAVVSIDHKISDDLWKKISDRNRRSSNLYKKAVREWRRNNK